MREVLYRGAILDLYRLDGRWEVVEHAEAVVILAQRAGMVLGVSQYRPALQATTWELPAGLIDPGESPPEAARRELAEETGLSGRLEFLTQVHTSPGFTTEKIHLFEASELEEGKSDLDDDEELIVDWRSPAEVWEQVRLGSARTSAPTLIGLLLALARSGFAP